MYEPNWRRTRFGHHRVGPLSGKIFGCEKCIYGSGEHDSDCKEKQDNEESYKNSTSQEIKSSGKRDGRLEEKAPA